LQKAKKSQFLAVIPAIKRHGATILNKLAMVVVKKYATACNPLWPIFDNTDPTPMRINPHPPSSTL
jgi:hypothetical protein